MRYKLAFVLICCILGITLASARTWQDDILGDDYKCVQLKMPNDYSGDVVTTVIRKQPITHSNKGVLYIHGYNDYFFQKELGDQFVAHGYNFYAVDLRKYGRSWLNHQRKFEVRDLKEYFADIDSAKNIMKEDRCNIIVLMGHSTGGLIASYYLVENKQNDASIKALLLNSPFMDMNLSSVLEDYALPLISALSGILPNIEIDQNSNDAYSQSLLKKHHGEWDYNTEWKLPLSPVVTTGWLGAIHKAQMKLQKGQDIKMPILLMRSDKSIDGDTYNPNFNRGDAVLDVNEISLYGRKLGKNVKELVVKNGLHDLMLSSKPIRVSLYDYIFKWLDKNVH